MATNGPYGWGSGPKPYGRVKRAKVKRKESGGCLVIAAALAGGLLFAPAYFGWKLAEAIL